MFKPLATLAASAVFLASCGGNGPLLGDLTRDTDTSAQVLDTRAQQLFPDGTPWPQLADALEAEGFDILREELIDGRPQDIDGRRSATAQYDYNFVCGYFANLRWEQRDGAVYNMQGRAFSGCL